MRPFVTFISDFGQRDTYVASVRMAILSRVQDAILIDVTHDIPPFMPLLALPSLIDILEVSPPDTIHLVVVDPGVGSPRRALIGSAPGHFFVFPDNGLPHHLNRWVEGLRFYHLSNPSAFGGAETATFQGRDLFAPAVAALCRGIRPEEMGEEISAADLVHDTGLSGAGADRLLVWNVDRFGNVLLGYRANVPPTSVRIAFDGIDLPYVSRYQDVPRGRPGILVNSSGWIEIFCREGSAFELTGFRPGMLLEASIEGGVGRPLFAPSVPDTRG